ncbi:MAG: glycosyl transferase family 28 [Fibrobacterota bacterium]|nr:glycosyl transferase family 28 [Fibrobacterota bacterium]
MRILVCPLDWGLGHATRSIPLIRALLENGHEVRIGASGGGKCLLQGEFPNLEVFDFPGYRVRYSRSPAFFLPVMLAQLPRVLAGMISEARRLHRILAERPCDLVISDGRYGVFTREMPCVFITHQVFIRVPGRFPGAGAMERLLLALNLRLLRRFARVWVPDFPGKRNLSGDLSHKTGGPGNLEFIHPLSRFSTNGDEPAHVNFLAMVSGPEPQRGLFEQALRKQLEALEGTRVLVRGLPEGSDGQAAIRGIGDIRIGALTEFDHLSGPDLARLFRGADLIVARSGYTTVMELAGIHARAVVLVPTPGQSEQEYLADHLEASGSAVKMDQGSFDLHKARERVRGGKGFAGWMGVAPSEGMRSFSLSTFIAEHALLGGSGIRSNPIPMPKAREL